MLCHMEGGDCTSKCCATWSGEIVLVSVVPHGVGEIVLVSVVPHGGGGRLY